ncbi:phage holin family protein [Flavobacterium panacagri]|uniref:phage holin family protein n=1 Tax=Flavobacterium panacagri TaxID=3034146 RepID=UPI0025A6431A|nr:phage holin family protein [Flavobacterium panacagri]
MKTFLLYLVTATCLFFTPIVGLLIAVGAAIVLDTAFGIYRSIKVKGWKFVTSRRLSEIISKMLLYEMCIICLYIIDFFALTEFFQKWFSISFFATKICAIVLIFIEGVSIKENFEKATGKDVWALIKKALGRANEIKDSITDLKNTD